MSAPSPLAPPPSKPRNPYRWLHRVLGLLLVIVAFELGLFLVVFPWLKSWKTSWIPVHSSHLVRLWMSPYFRGAISGLGLLNIYIALAEAARQLRSLFDVRIAE